ncbi:MAG: PA2778 family cysteine peptidase [Burkholderiaceae bacterium]
MGAARRHGLLAVALPPRLDAVLQELAQGTPVLMLVNLSLPVWPRWHYLVAVGYDLDAGDARVHSGTQRAAAWPLATLELTWARGGPWAMVALPPGRLPASTGPDEVWAALTALERLPPASTAAPWWAAAHARWPGDLNLALGQGNQLHAAGRRAEAAAVFEAAARQHDSAVAWNNLAQVRWQLGERGAAREAARRAWQRAQAAEPRWRDAVRATLAELGEPAP